MTVAGSLLLKGVDTGLGYAIWFNTIEIVGITLAVGIRVGLINGLLITRLNVAPFIDTPGTLHIARGTPLLSSGGRTYPNLGGSEGMGIASFPLIGTGALPGLPVMVWRMIGVALEAHYMSRRTPLGGTPTPLAATRGARSCRGQGQRVKLFVYAFSGCCTALVGIIIARPFQAAHPATGETFELNAIAAAELGGTSMSGGRGRIFGTIIGAFVIGILSDGLIMMGVSSFWQTVIKGVVIVLAVVIDRAQVRLQARVAIAQEAAASR